MATGKHNDEGKDIRITLIPPKGNESKCLCVFVIDNSGSMNTVVEGTLEYTGETIDIDGKKGYVIKPGSGITRKELLQLAIQDFITEIRDKEDLRQQLELCIVTFDDDVNVPLPPQSVEDVELPKLRAFGNTKMVDGINQAIKIVADRKMTYKEYDQNYTRPWIILVSDGMPDPDQNVDILIQKIKADTRERRYVFLPIGVKGADMNLLRKMEGDYPADEKERLANVKAVDLSDAQFTKFFKWLGNSIDVTANNTRPQVSVFDFMSDDNNDDFEF